MPNIVGSSISENIAPLDEKWMGCIVHQLNIVMKRCLRIFVCVPAMKRISTDLTAVKELFRIFKQSGWNHELCDAVHLIQKIATRFATTHAVAERFMRDGMSAFAVVDKHDSTTARSHKDLILNQQHPGGSHFGFPCVEAIVDASDMIVFVQKNLEASLTPTIHLVLPMIHKCKDKLHRIESGGYIERGFSCGRIPPSEYSVMLCRAMRQTLEQKIRVHDLWIVACILHPLLREMEFLDLQTRENYMQRSMNMIRRFLKDDCEGPGSTNGTQDESMPGNLRMRTGFYDPAQSQSVSATQQSYERSGNLIF